jgi:hypothetical protein
LIQFNQRNIDFDFLKKNNQKNFFSNHSNLIEKNQITTKTYNKKNENKFSD